MLGFIADVAFAHLFVQTPAGPMVAHAPVLVTAERRLRFHLARSNRMAAHLDGTLALASFGGPGAYISPDWYTSEQQVPTWNYITVEAEGRVSALGGDDLYQEIADLSAAHEARLAPKRPWTMDKLDPARTERMLKAIQGFELNITALRGTIKLGQNKSEADVEGVIAGLRKAGKAHQADLTESALQARRKRSG